MENKQILVVVVNSKTPIFRLQYQEIIEKARDGCFFPFAVSIMVYTGVSVVECGGREQDKANLVEHFLVLPYKKEREMHLSDRLDAFRTEHLYSRLIKNSPGN